MLAVDHSPVLVLEDSLEQVVGTRGQAGGNQEPAGRMLGLADRILVLVGDNQEPVARMLELADRTLVLAGDSLEQAVRNHQELAAHTLGQAVAHSHPEQVDRIHQEPTDRKPDLAAAGCCRLAVQRQAGEGG